MNNRVEKIQVMNTRKAEKNQVISNRKKNSPILQNHLNHRKSRSLSKVKSLKVNQKAVIDSIIYYH